MLRGHIFMFILLGNQQDKTVLPNDSSSHRLNLNIFVKITRVKLKTKIAETSHNPS